MFRSSAPVVARDFHDRDPELERVETALRSLAEGAPRWLAILGSRKVGKTSLLLEAARRNADLGLEFVMLDVFEATPTSPEVFRRLALRVVDRFGASAIGASLEQLALEPEVFREALLDFPKFSELPKDLARLLLRLPDDRLSTTFVSSLLQLPERLAQLFDRRVVVAIDEFQEITSLGRRRGGFDAVPLMRSIWQKHERASYVISGSERSVLLELVTARRSPFFQHFEILELHSFEEQDAIALLTRNAPRDRRIPADLARRAARTLGGHPFYLQVFGESLLRQEPPYDDRALKTVLQEVLFSRTGRLSLYMQRELERAVGDAGSLMAVLDALADGPLRHSEISKRIGAPSGATTRYIERLGDVIAHYDDGRYGIRDPAFASWVRWRGPGGTVVPMRLLGDDAENAVATILARMGFDLVYQSRGSRGAFDLLATRGSLHLGIQVKRSELPVRVPKRELNRMRADGKRLGWQWVIAAVSSEGAVTLFDPSRARVGREARFHEEAAIDNLLEWVEPASR